MKIVDFLIIYNFGNSYYSAIVDEFILLERRKANILTKKVLKNFTFSSNFMMSGWVNDVLNFAKVLVIKREIRKYSYSVTFSSSGGEVVSEVCWRTKKDESSAIVKVMQSSVGVVVFGFQNLLDTMNFRVIIEFLRYFFGLLRLLWFLRFRRFVFFFFTSNEPDFGKVTNDGK